MMATPLLCNAFSRSSSLGSHSICTAPRNSWAASQSSSGPSFRSSAPFREYFLVQTVELVNGSNALGSVRVVMITSGITSVFCLWQVCHVSHSSNFC